MTRAPDPHRRPRRLRRTGVLRALARETRLSPDRLVLPLFITDGRAVETPIGALPGHARLSADLAVRRVEAARAAGVHAFALFPHIDPALKTPDAGAALREDGPLPRAIRELKAASPDACLIADVALDPYSSHGHDGLIGDDARVLNDETVEVLARLSVLLASAGADVVAPSDMMDGRVRAIRAALDAGGLADTVIMSYAAKYASAFYGPFREALGSAPVSAPGVPGDKRTYQMDPANAREALLEAALDEAEGADVLMVKPALPYLDVIARLRARTDLPIAAYHVSGEYAAVKAAGAAGWLDADACLDESLTSIARAGADVIVTYGALEWAQRRG